MRSAAALEVLDLGATGCGDAGAVALARALGRRPPGSAAARVDVSDDEVSCRGVAALVASPSVVAVDARRNDLGADGAAGADAIVKALKKAPQIEALSLAHCGLGPAAARRVLDAAARHCPRLAALDLSGNAMTGKEVARRKAKEENAVVGALFKVATKALPPSAQPAADGGLGLGGLHGATGGGEGDVDAICAAAKTLAAGQAPGLRWLGLQNTGLTPVHAKLLAAAKRKRANRGAAAVLVEAGANAASEKKAKKKQEPAGLL